MGLEIRPLTLEGRLVRLEPFAPGHLQPLLEAAADPGIWTWYIQRMETERDRELYLRSLLEQAAQGSIHPFVTIERSTGRVAGSTSFMNIDSGHRRVEIGSTWLHPDFQRSGLNREAKLLQLTHLFEALGASRVEFKTDSRNERSRAALRRIGATEEGVLRNHMLAWNGRIRHSAYFSVIREEWPHVKAALERRIQGAG
jgi:N-acetyltransferase